MKVAGKPIRIDGRYEIRRRLGEGAFGAVYLCEDVELGRAVAVKVLHPGKAEGQMISRFQREARAAAMLHHPNVVTVYGEGRTSSGEPYLVTEYVEGHTLSDQLNRVGLPTTEVARRWIRQLAEALTAAHALGVVHRDVKPANILLDGDDCKLADFGLARIEDEMTRMTETGQIMGTPIYMAPEVFLGHEAKAQADVYSLAAIAYRMLYGQRWRSGGLDTLIAEARNAGPPPEDRFGEHPELDPALIWGLQPKPEHRAPTAEAFLEAFLGAEEPPPAPPPPAPPGWRRPAALGVGALLLVGAAIGSLLRSQEPPPGVMVEPPRPPPKEQLPEPASLARARKALHIAKEDVWGPEGSPDEYTDRARFLLPIFHESTMPLRYKRLLREVAAAAREGADFTAGVEALERVAVRWWRVENGITDDVFSRAYEEGRGTVDIAAWKRLTKELQELVDEVLDDLDEIEGGGALVRARLAAARILDGPRAGKAALQAAAHLPAAELEHAKPLAASLRRAVEAGNTTGRLGPDGDLAVITWLGRNLPPVAGRKPTQVWAQVVGHALHSAARTLRRRLEFTPPEGLAAFDRLLDTLWSFRETEPRIVKKELKMSYIRMRGRSMIQDQDAGEVSVRAWVVRDRLAKMGVDLSNR